MYTYHLFCFGFDLSKNKEIGEIIYEMDIEFKKGDYEIEEHYHGGKTDGQPQQFGIYITDDSQNPDFIKTVREAKEETYLKDFQDFVESFKKELDDFYLDSEDAENKNKLQTYLDTAIPEFYSIEVSS